MKNVFLALICVMISIGSAPCFAEMVKVASNTKEHYKIHPIFKKNPLVVVDYNPSNIISSINDEINKVNYVEDIKNYGVVDYWATPNEFFKNGGDCEDYVIAKYFALKYAGVSPKDMKIVILKRKTDGVYHAILEVKYKDDVYYLDNETNSFTFPKKYDVVYSVNEYGLWSNSKLK